MRVLLLLLASSVFGAVPGPEAQRIAGKFLAPCCWHENLAVHSSPAAEQMRGEIAGLVKEGKSESEIVDFYVMRYGERILREPRGSRGTLLVVIPVTMAGFGGLALWFYLGRARRFRPAYAAGPLAAIPDEEDWQ